MQRVPEDAHWQLRTSVSRRGWRRISVHASCQCVRHRASGAVGCTGSYLRLALPGDSLRLAGTRSRLVALLMATERAQAEAPQCRLIVLCSLWASLSGFGPGLARVRLRPAGGPGRSGSARTLWQCPRAPGALGFPAGPART
jgi:hypothetical protein